jgi:hypothetical protein
MEYTYADTDAIHPAYCMHTVPCQQNYMHINYNIAARITDVIAAGSINKQ